MSLNNFEKLRSNLYFNDNEKIHRSEPVYDKMYKTCPVIDSLFETVSSVYFEESLSTDEKMCATKIRHHL